jgi:hypothetical protein
MSKYGDFHASYFGAFFTKILCMMSHTEFFFGHRVPKFCPPKNKKHTHTHTHFTKKKPISKNEGPKFLFFKWVSYPIFRFTFLSDTCDFTWPWVPLLLIKFFTKSNIVSTNQSLKWLYLGSLNGYLKISHLLSYFIHPIGNLQQGFEDQTRVQRQSDFQNELQYVN